MPHQFSTSYIQDSVTLFHQYKKMAEKAIEQVTDEELHATLDPEANSIAVIMKHITGNMRSRWRDFLTTDGEKPSRNRDQEFEPPAENRDQLMAAWERSWDVVFTTIASLTPANLMKIVTIRGEPHTVLQAINRQIAHYAYHVGQIVFLAKHYKGADFHSLSIPKGKSQCPEALIHEKNRP